MPPNGVKSTFRGPLRYEVETSSPSLEAGKIFSIFLRITNPYDVPVVIRLVGFALPVEFDDETDHEESRGLIMPWSRSRTSPVKDGTTSSGITKDGGSTNPFVSNVAIAVGINRRTEGNPSRQDAGVEDPLAGAVEAFKGQKAGNSRPPQMRGRHVVIETKPLQQARTGANGNNWKRLKPGRRAACPQLRGDGERAG
jgi:hypothetical protein